MGRRPVQARDLLRVRWPMEPAVSPDGARVAFVVAGLDADRDRLVHRVHVLDVANGRTRRPGAGDQERRPRWSADGRRVAYLSDAGGTMQVHVVDLDDGSVRATGLPGDVTAFDLHPDGTRVACCLDGPAAEPDAGPVHRVTGLDGLLPADRSAGLWTAAAGAGDGAAGGGGACLVAAEGGAPRLPRWSPDGSAIAYAAGDRLWRVGADGASPRRLADGTVTALAWSPDGSAVALLRQSGPAGTGGMARLEVVDAQGRHPPSCWSAALDRSIGQVVRGDDERGLGSPDLAWTADGERVLAVYADGGRSRLAWFGADGRHGAVVGGDRAVLDFDAAPDGTLVWSWSDPWTPGELSLGSLSGLSAHGERACTSLNADWSAQVELALTVPVTHHAEDGTRVEGWLTRPVDAAGPVPLVLEVHGGPHYPVGWRFSMNAQRWAAHGYAVLRGNPRGSQGYGCAHAAAVHGDWGGRDHLDLLGLLDEAVEQAPADPQRLAIVGESYGGYIAAWSISQTQRFAVAVAENGIADLRAAGYAAADLAFWSVELGAPPWEAQALHTERSPITHVRDITTPLLLVCAEEDETVSAYQSEALFVALASLGRDVELLRIPGEGHFVNVTGAPSRRLARIEAVDRWLAGHLQRRAYPDAGEEAL